ncbi:HopJ type III effector protein [Neptunomonas antarctica]|uniref:HopJ type III effector protein n=1 Tax=Neptunomonas antarctica TaxID=619304 RepID=A0A1N7M7M8_9GAMM|nr:HopJ type III effector protein [Neptunomonas antarctica]SIS82074.1 HopJ type III effector protein [Neptunomonas antarctica]
MTLESFIAQLNATGQVEFEDTMAIINTLFDYTPTPFSNGLGDTNISNPAGQNEGSCKIFAFAQLTQLSKEQTLECFGRFYQDVLKTPQGEDHTNIRNFMRDGWQGIEFEGQALTAKLL